IASDPTNGNQYICVDGILHLFDRRNLNLNRIGVSCGSSGGSNDQAVSDDQAVYVVSGGNVLRLPHDGTSWQTIYGGGDASEIFVHTRNYLIVYTSYTSPGLKAVKKDGSGTVITLSTSSVHLTVATSDKVFFTEVTIGGGGVVTSIKACEWSEGSLSPTCSDNSYWAGASLATSGTVNTSGGILIPIYRLLRVDGVDLTNGYPSGGTLRAVNPSDGSTTDLGTVPNDFFVFGSGVGDHLLLRGIDHVNNQNDVFYVNLSSPNSLQNLTNTTNSSEYPIFLERR
ncbi:MAG: hypothetical protein Q9N26_03260, partial [Aquificota bacterium]|nr:hypothetical protein [Aquificota bacterium]